MDMHTCVKFLLSNCSANASHDTSITVLILYLLCSPGSSGHVSFSGLQPGLYVLRVHAFNSRADVRKIKREFVITSNPSYCSAVLINRGVVLSQNSSIATVEVKVYGPALQVSCRLDGGEEFSCE